jgi:hypothetical protein
MKKLIECGRGIVDLLGTPIPGTGEPGGPLTIGKTMANILMNSLSKGGDDVKLYLLAIEMYKDADVEIDAADMKTLRNAIETAQTTRLLKAQLLLALDEAKDTGEKKK